MARRLPERWLDYSRFGRPIMDTKIMAIKSPMQESIGGIPRGEEFTPTQCPQQLMEKLGLNLYAVIDLTNTDRYYDPEDFRRAGVQYHKLRSPGKQIPTEEIYQEFRGRVKSYLAEMSPDGLLAVHCTHGLNCTGYLVIRYLIDECGFATEEAITEVNTARGHDIDNQKYLDHLRRHGPHRY